MPTQLPAAARRPRPLSLVNTLPTPDAGADDRWISSFVIVPETCGDGGGIFDPCDRPDLTPGRRPANVEAEPFAVWEGDACSAMGITSDEEFVARARRTLERCQSKHVAAEFWSGTQATASGWPNKFLTRYDADVLTDGPTAMASALACLEQGISDAGCNEQGVIHATVQAVTMWHALQLVQRQGSTLYTIHDTIVVADAGYNGDGPAIDEESEARAAGQTQWAYGTSIPTVLLGPITVTPDSVDGARAMARAMDRSVNDLAYIAWRPAMATWDGCVHVAVELDLETCLVGGVS